MSDEVFIWSPSYGARKAHKPRVLSAAFGDGYEQRAGDGINRNPERWDLQFATRTDMEADPIDAFLSARGGVESFYFYTPFERVGLFICREWSRDRTGPNLSVLSATFEEVFDQENELQPLLVSLGSWNAVLLMLGLTP